jgi:uncharacterized protein (TIGR00369 family)
LKIDETLSGKAIEIAKGQSKVRLNTTSKMIADKRGLIHGGFIFSLADYCAMLTVNHPNVVLSKSSFKFIKPVRKGDIIIAVGKIIDEKGKKIDVHVDVKRENQLIGMGTFNCFIPKKHILEENS